MVCYRQGRRWVAWRVIEAWNGSRQPRQKSDVKPRPGVICALSPFQLLSRLLLHNVVQPWLQMSEVRSALLIRIGSEYLPSHESPWRSSASKQLELREPLLRENIETIHRDPASMSLSVALAQDRGVQRLVDELDHYTACGAFQPLWRQGKI